MRTTSNLLVPFAALAGIAITASLSGCSAPAADAASDKPETVASVDTGALVTDGTLTICTALSMALPPNYMYDETNSPAGMEIDLADDLAARLGLETQYVDVAFSSLIPTLQARQCDTIISSLYIKPEREEVVDFVPYVWQGQGIAVLEDNPKGIEGYDESLCGNSVATTIGTTAELNMETMKETCEAEGSGLEVVKFDNATSAAQSVMSGQQDALAAESPVIAYRNQQTDGRLVRAGEAYGLIKVGAAVSKDNAALRDALAEAFAGQKADGTYEQLLEEYGQTDMNIDAAF
ncbi:transporter substrate-binding domain-containing protein [Microbacterium sp. MEC084]|uniref:ABC transporter substrate-binding protein n=1 Tax=Microbacterium sp. MEC084 TaxID=1963027 RepID=UPI00106F26BF|nr:ABC transporter substrate-binding protein [Microbacterium sp. MEC084]MCD1270037.1 transporter substrate-binding domain-containing protein [Microbacterium sp. MEC084]